MSIARVMLLLTCATVQLRYAVHIFHSKFHVTYTINMFTLEYLITRKLLGSVSFRFNDFYLQ